MKKLITSAFFAFSVIAASASSDLTTINNQASDIARRMANQIELNEMEYIQVKNYTTEKLITMARIKDMYSNDPEMMMNKLQEAEVAYSTRVQNLLNTRQLETFMALHNSFKTNLVLIAGGE